VIDAPHPVPPARVQVAAQEFRFTLSRTRIKRGPAIVELVNFGEDPHDLRLRRIGGTKTYATPVVAPGETYDLVFRNMQVGRYRVWCGVANHAALGMRGVLIVTKR
jgi:plastocyanin